MELSVEVRQVAWCSIVGTRAIPRREVHRELQVVLLARLRQFAYDVALAVLVRRAAHVVVVALEGPQTEAVVMLRSEYHALHAGSHECLCPLLAVETCGVERSRIGVAVAPFAVVERVQTEVDESVGLHALPVDLLLLRERKDRSRSLHCALCRRGEAGKSHY